MLDNIVHDFLLSRRDKVCLLQAGCRISYPLKEVLTMFNLFFNKKKFTKSLAQDVVSETEKLFNNLNSEQASQFNEIKTVLQHLTEKMNQLENRLVTKELKDKTNYGHLQYKINELQSDIIFDNKKTKKQQ